MTRFAACFILVFGELAWGGLFALAIPPFFNVERGFYKSSASVYLAASLTPAIGLGLLALRGGASPGPGAGFLWTASALWTLSSAAVCVYLYTLWTEDGLLRSRAYAAGLGLGLIDLDQRPLALRLVRRAGLATASVFSWFRTARHLLVEVSSKDAFAIEAWLYRNLEVNCRQKANLAEEAAFGSKP